MSYYGDDIEDFGQRTVDITDPNKYYAVIFAGEVGDFDTTLVAEVTKGEESYWKIASSETFNNIQDAYNHRDVLNSGPMARLRALKNKDLVLFPGLTPEEKANVLYIHDEPEKGAGK